MTQRLGKALSWQKEHSVKRPELWLSLAIGLYLLSLVPIALGPLQLGDWDSSEYLAMAAVKADGHPFPQTRLPVGYPALVAAMDRGGVAVQAGFVVLNLIGLVVGMAAFVSLMRGQLSIVEILAICLATLLYRTTFELAAVPQPDLLFFGVSMLALACFAKPSRGAFIVGLALCAVAVSLRSIGLALIPATAWAAFHSNRRAGQRAVSPPRRLGCHSLNAREVGGLRWRIREAILPLAGRCTNSLDRRCLSFRRGRRPRDKYALAPLALAASDRLDLRPLGGVLSLAAAWALEMAPIPCRGLFRVVHGNSLLSGPALMPRFWVPVVPLALAFAWVGGKSIAKKFAGPPQVLFAALAACLLWFSALGLYGIDRGIEFSRGGAAALLATQRRAAQITTAELAALNPPDLALMPNVGLAANRYGKSQ